MELGNIAFGHSWGGYPVPRSWEGELIRLFDAYAPNRDNSWRDYGEESANEVFEVHPYYWGVCMCGYVDKEGEWSDANQHREACYQTIVSNRVETFKKEVGYSDTPTPTVETRLKLAREVGEFEREVRKELCEELGLAFPNGCAVHCTCDLPERWDKFSAENTHVPMCPIVLPNFWYKPTNFRLEWYKYPLRDSYMNKKVSLKKFKAMIDACIKSLA